MTAAKKRPSRGPAVFGLALILLLVLSLGIRHRERLGGLIGGLRRQASERRTAAVPGRSPEIAPPDAAPPALATETPVLRIQIHNATGVNRLALQLGEQLREWGVDALDRGNAPAWPFPETLLIVRRNEIETMAAVRELGRRLGGVPVILQARADLMLDATLILGHDWEQYNWPAP